MAATSVPGAGGLKISPPIWLPPISREGITDNLPGNLAWMSSASRAKESPRT